MAKKRDLDLKKVSYYRLEKTGIKKPTTRKRKVDGQLVEQYYEQEVLQRVYYTYNDFEDLSLEKLGVPLPADQRGYTTINNYFLDYWGAIMGAEVTALYIHLLRYCYGDKDYCFPELDVIGLKMKKAPKTLLSYLQILETHGFIFRFWLQDPSDNNVDCGIIYKIRRTIPVLSEELIESLELPLRLAHDSDIRKIMNSFHIELAQTYDYSNDFERIRRLGRAGKLPKELSAAERALHYKKKVQTLQENSSIAEKQLWSNILQHVKGLTSRNSFETWFTDTFCRIENDKLIVFSANSFHASWLENRYKEIIQSAVQASGEVLDRIEFQSIIEETI
ncbi:DnaA N-terminal domain-containing protein [Brevibacillus laterosporus]|uniref:DnaA N-terminal domain-containing protein n=1 Tax=Brevibacillus laterosporus TaxID=1465 RepID=UPI001EF355A3|nr:DnaA N-terminal domain-containing protein [Brevibacillus laterosporus]MCG7320198.1 replication initiation protein [Brevibacillus laterosporus]